MHEARRIHTRDLIPDLRLELSNKARSMNSGQICCTLDLAPSVEIGLTPGLHSREVADVDFGRKDVFAARVERLHGVGGFVEVGLRDVGYAYLLASGCEGFG